MILRNALDSGLDFDLKPVLKPPVTVLREHCDSISVTEIEN